MKYTKPNFDEEWMEALRYREFEKMGKEGWIEVANKNYDIISFDKIEDVLNNTDLDYDSLDEDKRKRFEEAFEKGEVEIPIAVKFADNDYDLLGGNTRLAGLLKNGINPKLWIVDLTDQKSELKEKWSEKYKKSIDCNNPKGFSQRAHCQGRKKKVSESEELKGGLADDKTLAQIAKKHDAKNYYHIKNMMDSLRKQLHIGMEVEMEHTDDKEKAKEIAMDHLWEDPTYYTKLKKIEAKEMTGGDSSGSFEGPAFGGVIKKKHITKIHNMTEQEQEIDEVTDGSSSGAFDVPLFGGTKGRKNPLSIGGPDTIYKGRAVKDKKFPKWGGPGGKFVKIADKCKKYPYCNQGDMSALELLETEEIKNAIQETAKKYGLPVSEVEKLVSNQLKQIFI
jgi:hypothetical protein